MLGTFDTNEYRRQLAGLSDQQASSAAVSDASEDASDLVLLLAICFNRKLLDAKTLWTRIESAITKAIHEVEPSDTEAFVSTCLEHVKADANVAACQVDSVRIQKHLYDLDAPDRLALVQYLSDHRFPVIMIGRSKWEERKSEIEETRKTLEEVE